MAKIDTYDIVGAKEVIKICGFNKFYLHALIKNGKIPARKVARDWIFSRTDVIAFQKAREKKAKTDKRIRLKK